MFKLQTSENYRDIFTIMIVFKQNIVIVIVPLSPRPNFHRAGMAAHSCDTRHQMPMFSQMHPVPMAAVFSQYQWDCASYTGWPHGPVLTSQRGSYYQL